MTSLFSNWLCLITMGLLGGYSGLSSYNFDEARIQAVGLAKENGANEREFDSVTYHLVQHRKNNLGLNGIARSRHCLNLSSPALLVSYLDSATTAESGLRAIQDVNLLPLHVVLRNERYEVELKRDKSQSALKKFEPGKPSNIEFHSPVFVLFREAHSNRTFNDFFQDSKVEVVSFRELNGVAQVECNATLPAGEDGSHLLEPFRCTFHFDLASKLCIFQEFKCISKVLHEISVDVELNTISDSAKQVFPEKIIDRKKIELSFDKRVVESESQSKISSFEKQHNLPRGAFYMAHFGLPEPNQEREQSSLISIVIGVILLVIFGLFVWLRRRP